MNTSRRKAIQAIGLSASSLAVPSLAAANLSARGSKAIHIGLIADVHIGLSPNAEKRLSQFVGEMKKESPDAMIQLGDFAFPNKKHQAAPEIFKSAKIKNSLHTIGNHDLDFGLTTKDCLKAWGMPDRFYRYDLAGIRVLVLDCNDKGSPKYKGGYPAYVGKKQLDWLEKELKLADRPLLIVSHQPLAGPAAIDNAPDVQKMLSRHADQILLCINGHTHIDKLVEKNGVRFLHVNSASYFWMGGKVRMAHYKDPLYTTLSIEPDKGRIVVQGKKTEWVGKSPEEHGYFTSDKDRKDLRMQITPQIRSRTITKA